MNYSSLKLYRNIFRKKNNLKEFSEYTQNYMKYLQEKEIKNTGNTLFSSYEEDEDTPYNENWADVF